VLALHFRAREQESTDEGLHARGAVAADVASLIVAMSGLVIWNRSPAN